MFFDDVHKSIASSAIRNSVMLMWWLLLLYAYGGNAIAQPTSGSSSCLYSDYYGYPTNFTNGPLYQGNVTALLSSLTSHSANGFYNTSVVHYDGIDDEIYGLSFCWGYASASRCQSCVATASQQILRKCPNHNYAEIAYDVCMLRYWNDWSRSSLEELNLTIFTDSLSNTSESLDPNECKYVDEYMRDMILQLRESFSMFRATEFQISASVKRYGSVQCSHVGLCVDCLKNLIDQFNGVCRGWRAWWVMTNYPFDSSVQCAMRYGDLPFYIPDGSPPAPPPGRSKILIISIICGLAAIALLICFILWCKNKKAEVLFHDRVQNKESVKLDLPMIPFSILQHSTLNFSDQCKLGKGGFGTVYKAILPDGRHTAVKRLSKTSGQGLEEFKNEVTFISNLHHKNLVTLFGCCIEHNEKLLVYEYMPNGSLDFHLFDKEKKNQLDWNLRCNIIIGIAKGLLYLHEYTRARLQVIHRDLKASNILLDFDMTPKISDFGLARAFWEDQRQASTRRIAGTYGYMAPEYVKDGLFSTKSDIFSFGVLVLEIASGRRNTEFYLSEHGLSLLTYAWRLWCEGNVLMLMDPVLQNSCIPSQVIKCIHIGLLCVQEDAANRPTMPTIASMLESDTMVLPNPTQPAFSVERMMLRQVPTSNNSKNCSINQVTISTDAPR